MYWLVSLIQLRHYLAVNGWWDFHCKSLKKTEPTLLPPKPAWFLPATPYIHVPPLSPNHQCFPAFLVIPYVRSQHVYIFSLSFAAKWVRKSDRAFTGWEQICICIKCISGFLNSFNCTRHFYNKCVHRLAFCSHCPFFPPTEQHPDLKISSMQAKKRMEEKLWLPVAWERRKKREQQVWKCLIFVTLLLSLLLMVTFTHCFSSKLAHWSSSRVS